MKFVPSGNGEVLGDALRQIDVGESVPLSSILGRTEDVAAGVGGVVAYRQRFSFNVLVIVQNSAIDLTPWRANRVLAEGKDLAAAHQAGGLMIEVVFATGATANNIDSIAGLWQPSPVRPIMITRYAAGGNGWWQMTIDVLPLPPPGPLTVHCQWEAVGLDFRREFESQPILEAARRSIELVA